MEALFKPSPEQVGKREDEGGDLLGGGRLGLELGRAWHGDTKRHLVSLSFLLCGRRRVGGGSLMSLPAVAFSAPAVLFFGAPSWVI